MSDKITLTAQVDSNIGEVTKDVEGLASEFKVMGISLNDVKKGFSSVATIAKRSFGTVKAALISTGIGALVVAVGSLVAYFTQTEKGAEKLKVIFAGLGAAVQVIVDRIADFGGAILKFFKGDFSAAAQEMKEAFTGIGEEIVEDTRLMMELERATNALRDSERDLAVETAERRAEIEKLKMIAEDVTKSEEERLKAAQDAFDIEQALLDKRVENAEEAVRIAQQQVDASHSAEEDLDNIRDKEIALANIQAESATKSIELNNKINAIKAQQILKNEELARQAQAERDKIEAIDNQLTLNQLAGIQKLKVAEQQAHEARVKAIETEFEDDKRRTEALEKNYQLYVDNITAIDMSAQASLVTENLSLEQQMQDELAILQEDGARARADKAYEIMKQRAQEEIDNMNITNAQKERLHKNLNLQLEIMDAQYADQKKALDNATTANTIGALGTLATAAASYVGGNKDLAIAGAIMSTYAGAAKALEQGGFIAGIAGAAAVILNGMASVNQIMKTDVPGHTSGGAAAASMNVPAPEFFSGGFDLEGATTEQEPLQAYVLTDEMTNSQNQLANIRRRATI